MAATPAKDSRPIRVVIVEDRPDVSLALVETLAAAGDIVVTRTFGSGEEAVAEVARAVPDVVLMDLRLPGMSGVECVRRIKAMNLSLHIMMFTAFEDDADVFDSLAAGANGYLVKPTEPAAVFEAIRELHRGGSPMSPSIARKLVKHFQAAPRPPQPTPAEGYELSDREQQVLQMLAEGLRYKEIANRLKISIPTVRTYLGRIYDKLHVTSRAEAIVKYANPNRDA